MCLFKAKESPFFFLETQSVPRKFDFFLTGNIESNGVCIYLGCQGSSTEFIEEQDIE